MQRAGQCESYWTDLRCQPRADHASVHAARDAGALVSWKSGVPTEYANRIVLDWADGQDSRDA